MKKISFLVVAVLIVALAIAGCSQPAAQQSNSQYAWTTSGETVTFYLRDISGSTGYTWSYDISNPEVLSYVSDAVEANDGAAPGASSIREFVFKGVKEGSTTLTFAQGPDWDTTASDGSRLVYEVSVSADGKVSVG